MSVRGLRNALGSFVPQWLANRPGLNAGYRILYAIATQGDILVELGRQGVLSWFPGLTLNALQTLDVSSTLPIVAASRGITQGFAESGSGFAARAVQWIDLWRFAGRPGGMLLALLGYCLPVLEGGRTVDNSGNWYSYPAGPNPWSFNPPTPPTPYPTNPVGNFRWDTLSQPYGYATQWYRIWPIVYSPGGTPWAAPSQTWAPATGTITTAVTAAAGSVPSYYSGTGGSGTAATQFNWDDGASCWDWAGTALQAKTLVTLCQPGSGWKAAHTSIPTIVVSYDATMFDPSQAFGSAKLPDGRWGCWAKVVAATASGAAGVPSYYAPSRPASTTCSFLSGVPGRGIGSPANGKVYA